MADHFLQLRVIYQDLHLIELAIAVMHGDWSAVSTAYVSPSFLTENGEAILHRIEAPNGPLNIEAGADTGLFEISPADDDVSPRAISSAGTIINTLPFGRQ
jgi:hypothetical protein